MWFILLRFSPSCAGGRNAFKYMAWFLLLASNNGLCVRCPIHSSLNTRASTAQPPKYPDMDMVMAVDFTEREKISRGVKPLPYFCVGCWLSLILLDAQALESYDTPHDSGLWSLAPHSPSHILIAPFFMLWLWLFVTFLSPTCCLCCSCCHCLALDACNYLLIFIV